MARNWDWLKTWEALLMAILLIVVIINTQLSSNYLNIDNLVNVFHLFIEKIIVVLFMTLIIINGEIDLSVGSVMGLSAGTFAYLFREGYSAEVAVLVALSAGLLCGLVNGIWVSVIGLPSLAVTLAGLIGYRGLARVLLEDQSIRDFPDWFNQFGQDNLIGPFPGALIIFAILFVIVGIVLHYSAFGRYVYIIGNNKEAALYSGIKVRRVKMTLFVCSSLAAAMAGVLYAARLGAVRGDSGEGFELDIITMVLLGGVSIFGGKGTLVGVGLSILVVLNIRNGMSLGDLSGDIQTSVIGSLLILSVLVPNLAQQAQEYWARRQLVLEEKKTGKEELQQTA
jgi:rhamnose transport system permease protein